MSINPFSNKVCYTLFFFFFLFSFFFWGGGVALAENIAIFSFCIKLIGPTMNQFSGLLVNTNISMFPCI